MSSILNLQFFLQILDKGTVSLISCDLACKDGNARFSTIPLKELCLIKHELVINFSSQNNDGKIIMQGKLFQRCTHFLYCSVLSLGGNGNTRRMSKPDMGSIFHIENQWNILVLGNYYVNYVNYQNLMLLSSSDTRRTLMHLLFLQISTRENWFQYVRRVYETAINFPCIITLNDGIFQIFDQIIKISRVSLWIGNIHLCMEDPLKLRLQSL